MLMTCYEVLQVGHKGLSMLCEGLLKSLIVESDCRHANLDLEGLFTLCCNWIVDRVLRNEDLVGLSVGLLAHEGHSDGL